jgi:trigger factor
MVLRMEVKVEEISSVERKLSVAVPSQNVDEQMDLAYRSWGKKAKIKGFRPGKVPRSILQRYYGKEIEEQVSQELFQQSLNEALDEVKLQPVMVKVPNTLPPLVQGNAFSYSVELEVAPDFTPENYLNIELESAPVVVTEEMVDKRLEELRQRQSTLTSIDEERPVQKNDFVVLDYQAYENGSAIEGGGSTNAYLEVGAGKLPGEFEDRIVGMNKGQEITFTMDVPADFINPAIAGKKVEFKVKVQEIKKLEVPELDDAFAQTLSDEFKTLADLRQAVHVDLEQRGERENYQKMREQVMDKIIASNPIDLPPSLIRQEQERLVRQQLQMLQGRGLNVAGLDPEKMLERVKELAEKQTRINLVLDKIAAKEGITVTDEDLEAGYQRVADDIGDKKDMVKKIYQQRQIEDDFKSQIRAEKTVEFVIEKANVKGDAAETETAEAKKEDLT